MTIKKNLVLFLFFSAFTFTCELSQAQTGNKHALTDASHVKTYTTDSQPAEKRPKLASRAGRLCQEACQKAGMTFKKCQGKAKKWISQCVNPETESIGSDSEYDDPNEIVTYEQSHDLSLDLDSTPLLNNRDTIKAVHQHACYLQSLGEPTLAAETLEQAIYNFQYQNIPTDAKVLPEFFGLFQLWASLPHITKEKTEAQKNIKIWMGSWPATKWLELASEVLVEMLAEAFEIERYDEILLNDVLSSIENQQARDSIRQLVQASATEDLIQREEHLRNAILTGYSHPLPYLQMIDHLVSQQRHEDAHHIFEMYRLAVIFNSYWSNSRNAEQGPEYDHRREIYRLQGVYNTVLDQMKEHVYTLSNRFLPSVDRLNGSLKAWPESSRQQAEDMLFEKTFETDWNMHEPILEFSNAVIARSRQRWLDSGKLEEQIAKVQNYIRHAYARRCLPILHEQLALMLTDQGREQEAADLLYGFVSVYREGVGTDYDLSLYLIYPNEFKMQVSTAQNYH